MTERKKRKPPKNQRAYATPSGKKARIVEITHAQSLALANSDIATPVVYFDKGKYYVKADEWRKYSAGNPPTSSAEQT